MSDLSILRDNIELILAQKEEIQNYGPYKFSRLTILHPNRISGSWYQNNMFMGAYVNVWHEYLQEFHEPAILPLYVGSGLFGAIHKFLGLSLPDKKLVKEVPKKMSVSYMRDPMWKFIKENPVVGLGVPLSQIVEELKVGKPVEERESFKLLMLREDFYRTVSTYSNIQHEGESDLSYRLSQDGYYRFRIEVKATIHLELNDQEKRKLVLDGSAVELHEKVLETKKDLASIAIHNGFPDLKEEDSRTNLAVIKFTRVLPAADEVLGPDNISALSNMLHMMRKRILMF